ncbi:MAG: DUF21 domain-containing protein, partial [Myxococcota bacterium]|nr:DUF21 domain-containing protein [Myxococcota bacterium]
MSVGTLLILIALCILVQGFFSGSEIALVSANRLKLRSQADSGRRGAALVLKILERPTFALGTCLIGTNICNISAATLGALLVGTVTDLHESVSVLFLAPIMLITGEMVPKTIYQHHADRLAPVIIYPLRLIAWIMSP